MRKGSSSSSSVDAQKENKNRSGIRPVETKDAGNGGFKTGMNVKGNQGNRRLPK